MTKLNDHFDNSRKVFWLGVNGMEYISWENSLQVIEYDPYYHPLPSSIIHYHKRIESEGDMYESLANGSWYSIEGNPIDNPASSKD